MRERYHFIDWCRGLACVLMFQTHAYDGWTRPADKTGWFWELSNHQLGGLPSRLFLFLAGTSLMLRFEADHRRGVPLFRARIGASLRGLQILGLGCLFRLVEWLLYGADLAQAGTLLRVDILNCIGVCLILGAWVASPRDLEPGPRPLCHAALALLLVMLTPVVERVGLPAAIPAPLRAYFIGERPHGIFPILPWFAYLLCGCTAGALWLRRNNQGLLPATMTATLGIGAALAIIGQAIYRSPLYIGGLPPSRTSIPLSSPSAFVYRMGLVLMLCALSYLAVRRRDPRTARPSPLLILGQTSLFAYWIHVELVYGHASDGLRARLSPAQATLGLLVLTVLMVGLCWVWRGFRQRRRLMHPSIQRPVPAQQGNS